MTDLEFIYRGVVAIAFWGKRAENPGPLADRFMQQIDKLTTLDPGFELWHCGATRPKKFEMMRDRFVDEVKASIVRDDYNEPDPIFGYSVLAVPRRQPSFSLNARAGATYASPFLQNSVEFSTFPGDVTDPKITTYNIMREALNSFIELWKPVYGEVYPRALRQFFRQRKSVFHEAWMHYLSEPLAQRIEPPRDILVETFPDGGILMSATTDPFDVDNPAHLAGARAIEAAIRPLNDIPTSEYGTG